MKIMPGLLRIFALVLGLPLLLAGCRPAGERLTIFNWEDYLSPEVISAFERKYGAEVEVRTFPDEKVLLWELREGENRYDLIVASNSLMEKLIRLDLLAPIDLDAVPNFRHLEDRFWGLHYDPKNRYSIPYLWGTTGLAVNREKIPGESDSWEILWNPEYRGRIAMLSDPDEVIGAALKYLGYSINSINHEELKEAEAVLLDQKPFLAGYLDPGQIKEKMAAGEIWAAQCYSGDAIMIAEDKPEVVYLIPREGADLWVDNFAIPANAENPLLAEKFINFCLDPENSAANANYLRYANTNQAARPHTDPEILNHPGLYPTAEVIDRCEITSLETFPMIRRIREEIWARLAAGEKIPPDPDDRDN